MLSLQQLMHFSQKGTSVLDQEHLEFLMDRAWPAVESEDTGEWVLRASNGVTQRANSVWPRHAGKTTVQPHISRSVKAASAWYRKRRLPLIFQIVEDHRTAALNAVLDLQGFTRQSETSIMVRGITDLPVDGPGAGVELSADPSSEWIDVWWAVDGRGGDAELAVARRILAGCPAVYALVRDDDGVPAAVGRLALVDGWGGIYGMATSLHHRRRGYGSQVLSALLRESAARRLEGLWLLVTQANDGARSLYANAGFVDHGSYLYRQAPLTRGPSGC